MFWRQDTMDSTVRGLYRCAVVGCKIEHRDRSTFHRVPAAAQRRKLWLQRMGLPASTPEYPRPLICGRHFTADDYNRRADVLPNLAVQCRRRLLATAVPTQFLPGSQQPLVPQTFAMTVGPLDSAYPSYGLPKKCQCSCHPKTSSKGVQTSSIQNGASVQTSSGVGYQCRCNCHYVMKTVASQTVSTTRASGSQTTKDFFEYAQNSKGVAATQVNLNATICMTVASQTSPRRRSAMKRRR